MLIHFYVPDDLTPAALSYAIIVSIHKGIKDMHTTRLLSGMMTTETCATAQKTCQNVYDAIIAYIVRRG